MSKGQFLFLPKKDPGNRLIGLLISSQLAEQALGQNRIAVFFPLALFHPDHHPLGIDIAKFEMNQLVDSKSRRVRGHQQTAITQFDGGFQQSLDLSGA
jgi:hypothetical protein